MNRISHLLAIVVLIGAVVLSADGIAYAKEGDDRKPLRAGAFAIDITPEKLPVIVSGGFLEGRSNKVRDRLHARCLVLDAGTGPVAIVVVDSLMMPRSLVDAAKALAAKTTGIRPERMMISATHTHSAPSVMGALGTGTDEAYAKLLPGRIAKVIERAAANLAAARVGWTVAQADKHTHCRRWIRRSDRMGTDPFGKRTVRAMMHPGYRNANYVGPAGPVDTGLSLLSIQSLEGRPIALLANYSMHYFGAPAVSADYFGRFAAEFARLVKAENTDPPFVAMMSQGTSGDLHWMDYSRPRQKVDIADYTSQLAKIAFDAYGKIEHHKSAPLAMAEKKLKLRRRTGDEARLEWAKAIVAKMGDRKPANRPEVYAREQIYLRDNPAAELKLQALRIGDLGIVAIPCEVFGITGLQIKARSPLGTTFNLELANGGEGYIPPPAQHGLGGYTTWPARTAGLEVQAEPKIVETVLGLLEEVSGKPARKYAESVGPYAKAVLASKPVALWRMGEFNGPRAVDVSGRGNHGRLTGPVAYWLKGPQAAGFCGPNKINRAVQFAGGRLGAVVKDLADSYSIEMWFSNGMPPKARLVAGYLFSRGVDRADEAPGEHLGIGGTHDAKSTGRLIFFNGNKHNEVLIGTTTLRLNTFNHVVLVRKGRQVTVYLNGNTTPEISGQAAPGCQVSVRQVFIGGRNDNFANFEGKIDEVSIYDRPLKTGEVASHYRAAGLHSTRPGGDDGKK
ncbi:MAG: LamG domain-containing protein [Phycisphaerae bacterium]|nr:LamG domain-containing protein [Phycisphaerae bacterium]